MVTFHQTNLPQTCCERFANVWQHVSYKRSCARTFVQWNVAIIGWIYSPMTAARRYARLAKGISDSSPSVCQSSDRWVFCDKTKEYSAGILMQYKRIKIIASGWWWCPLLSKILIGIDHSSKTLVSSDSYWLSHYSYRKSSIITNGKSTSYRQNAYV